MLPKEKAKELVDQMFDKIEDIEYGDFIEGRRQCAKQCALIAVGLIIKEIEQLHKPEYTTFITKHAVYIDGGLSEEPETSDGYERLDYWNEVKEEVDNL